MIGRRYKWRNITKPGDAEETWEIYDTQTNRAIAFRETELLAKSFAKSKNGY